jgi:hypothetical protein
MDTREKRNDVGRGTVRQGYRTHEGRVKPLHINASTMYIIARRININAALQKKTNKNIQVS